MNLVKLMPFSLSLLLVSFYVPFSVLTQVGRFSPKFEPHLSLSFARALPKRPFFRSCSKTSLHLFLDLPFPAFPGTTIFLKADTKYRYQLQICFVLCALPVYLIFYLQVTKLLFLITKSRLRF